MRVVGLTHVGNVRTTNEDAVFQHLEPPCYVLVADGMGGHAAGEVASSVAAQAVSDHIASLESGTLDADQIIDAIQYANRRIIEEIDGNPAYAGMGTTITLAYLQRDSVIVAHVGDSSAYLCRQGKLHKITKDHTYVQKLIDCGVLTNNAASEFPFRNVITRALGMPQVKVDMYREMWQPGDSILVCSDGLTAYADTERLLEELASGREVEEQAQRLMEFALDRGGRDNISVIIAKNTPEEAAFE